MEKQRYLPPALGLAAASYRLELTRALGGIEHPVYPYNLRPDDIYTTMTMFLETETTFVNQLIQQELKSDCKTPEPKDIHIIPYAKSELYEKSEKPPTHFWKDTLYGMSFYLGDYENQNGVYVGFSFLTFDQIFELKEDGINTKSLIHRCPVITQLQGPTFRELKSVEPVLEEFRWSIILVDLISFWAQKAGFPCIYILPGNYNKYYDPDNYPERAKRLIQRYNFTARRCGFRRPTEQDLFKKDLGVFKI